MRFQIGEWVYDVDVCDERPGGGYSAWLPEQNLILLWRDRRGKDRRYALLRALLALAAQHSPPSEHRGNFLDWVAFWSATFGEQLDAQGGQAALDDLKAPSELHELVYVPEMN